MVGLFMMVPLISFFKEGLTIADLMEIPTTSVITLAEVLECYDTLPQRNVHKRMIIIKAHHNQKIEIWIVSINDLGEIWVHKTWFMEKSDIPAYFIRQIEAAGENNQLINGQPAFIIDFPGDVREYIFKRANEEKNKLTGA